MRSNPKNYRNRARRHTGQSIVESVIMLCFVILPLTFAMLQFGIVINATNTLTQLAREGGRYAALHGTEGTSPNYSNAAVCDYIQAVAAKTSIKPSDIPDANITISLLDGTQLRASGKAISVQIKYPMAVKCFLPTFIPYVNRLRQDYYARSTFILE